MIECAMLAAGWEVYAHITNAVHAAHDVHGPMKYFSGFICLWILHKMFAERAVRGPASVYGDSNKRLPPRPRDHPPPLPHWPWWYLSTYCRDEVQICLLVYWTRKGNERKRKQPRQARLL